MLIDDRAPRFRSMDHVLREHLSGAGSLLGKPFDWFSASGLAAADRPQGTSSSVALRSREGRVPPNLRKAIKNKERIAAAELGSWADALRRALGADGLRITYDGLRADACGATDVAIVPIERGLVECVVHRNRSAWEGVDLLALRITPGEAPGGVIRCHRQTDGPRVQAKTVGVTSVLGDALPLVRAAVREPLAGLQRLAPEGAVVTIILRFTPPPSAHASLRAAAAVAERLRGG